jgi:hypothetical protein
MSLLNIFRCKTDEISKLKEENRILREEVKTLKELLYGIELEYTAKILKK